MVGYIERAFPFITAMVFDDRVTYWVKIRPGKNKEQRGPFCTVLVVLEI